MTKEQLEEFRTATARFINVLAVAQDAFPSSDGAEPDRWLQGTAKVTELVVNELLVVISQEIAELYD